MKLRSPVFLLLGNNLLLLFDNFDFLCSFFRRLRIFVVNEVSKVLFIVVKVPSKSGSTLTQSHSHHVVLRSIGSTSSMVMQAVQIHVLLMTSQVVVHIMVHVVDNFIIRALLIVGVKVAIVARREVERVSVMLVPVAIAEVVQAEARVHHI